MEKCLETSFPAKQSYSIESFMQMEKTTTMNSAKIEKPETRHKPRVLMVTHVLPCPPAAGNEIRIYKLLMWFKKSGYRVTLVLKPLNDDEEVPNQCILGLRTLVEDIHVFDNRVVSYSSLRVAGSVIPYLDLNDVDTKLKNVQDMFCPPWFAAEVERIAGEIRPDVVIAQYVFMSRILTLPGCLPSLKIIDAHDLFCRKQATVEQYGIRNYNLSLTEQQERSLLLRADVVLAIQAEEQEEIMRIVTERRILMTSIDLDVRTCDPRKMNPGQVLIVASSNEFNIRGTQDFIDYTWPLVRETDSSVRLRVIGRVCQYVRSDDPSISLLGFVENLAEEYEKAEVVINPCRVGTGIKIKTIEALSFGKAHVAWPSAADGLRDIGYVPMIIATNVVEFADSILSILSNSIKREILEAKAYRFIEEHFCMERVYASLASEIDGVTSRQKRVA